VRLEGARILLVNSVMPCHVMSCHVIQACMQQQPPKNKVENKQYNVKHRGIEPEPGPDVFRTLLRKLSITILPIQGKKFGQVVTYCRENNWMTEKLQIDNLMKE
jgi:hypothetical protein